MSLDNLNKISELQEKYFFRLPYAYIIADYVWPGIIMSPQRILSIQDFEFGSDDIVIATYPKSGTTWMSELISALVYEGDIETLRKLRQEVRVPWLELDQQRWWIRTFLKWAPILGWSTNPEQPKTRRRVVFTHLPLELLPQSIIYGKCKIIYVARNPKDNAVSFYHYHRMARFLGVQKNLTWDEFFPLYLSGSIYCGSWFEHVISFWCLSKQQSQRVLFVKFEDMKSDMYNEVQKIMQFLNLQLTEEQLLKVLEHCSFDSMKNNRMANRDIPYLFDNKVCTFMRKGQIGDWKNYFTIAQSALFDSIYEKKMQGTGLNFHFDP